MTWLRQHEHSLLDTVGRSPVEWYLIYLDSWCEARWWSRLFKKRFRHVGAVRRDGRVWVYVDPSFEFFDVRILRTDDPLHVIFGPDAIIQRVSALRTMGKIRAPLCSFSCVEVCKALLGIRSVWVQTPYQLFRYCQRINSHG